MVLNNELFIVHKKFYELILDIYPTIESVIFLSDNFLSFKLRKLLLALLKNIVLIKQLGYQTINNKKDIINCLHNISALSYEIKAIINLCFDLGYLDEDVNNFILSNIDSTREKIILLINKYDH